jgi:hypothetical protein
MDYDRKRKAIEPIVIDVLSSEDEEEKPISTQYNRNDNDEIIKDKKAFQEEYNDLLHFESIWMKTRLKTSVTKF